MRRLLLAGIALLFTAMIQTSVFNMIPYLSASPNLLLIITFSIGILRGSGYGVLCGFCSGLFLDLFTGQYLGFTSWIYMIIGYLSGFPYQHLTVDIPLVPIIASMLSEFLYHNYIFIIRFVTRNRLNYGFYFKDIILPEMLLTMIFAIIIFGILYYLNNYLEDYEKRSALKFV